MQIKSPASRLAVAAARAARALVDRSQPGHASDREASVMPSGRSRARGFALALLAALASKCIAQDAIGSAAPDAAAKTWTFSAGLGSSKAWNLVGVTKEFPLGEHAAWFLAAGLGEMILGAGFAYYSDREGGGYVASVVAGTGVQAALSDRIRLGPSDSLALGASYIRVFGFSNINRPQFAPIVAYEHRF
jgi:hypothetical protein